MLRKAMILSIILGSAVAAMAGSVILEWDPNSEADLAGYKVYSSRTGRPPFTYRQTVMAPAVTCTLANISTSLPHVFAVTAFNNMSTESAYSNRVKISVPHARISARISGSVTSGF
jgi:hypothetical protein